MWTKYLLVGTFAVDGLAGPAKRDCPMVNCWDECSLTGSQPPCFTASLCISSVADATATNATNDTTTFAPEITSAPDVTAMPDVVLTIELNSVPDTTPSFEVTATPVITEAPTVTGTPAITTQPESSASSTGGIYLAC
ncbi:hypothetical protein K458DRAFT_388555 [Lentithecium fluviatile CBS 122367]|uniref:Uncharacterized protein n=1 Tax=Lentithecium fluviatile CBS 122367 TaxID=1168545 RepID=A0A6G1J375_9PLEO|nr:hypothetical protein K458DRAFT_388555 [Lentithecium fluviatile CBS 122367]